MIRTTFHKAIVITCFVTGASLTYAQGTMPESSPTASDMATTPNQQLTDSQITTVLMAANNAEISQGKLAQKTAKSKDVVQFAKQHHA